MALKPLHDAAGIRRIVVSTYQSVSGAGKEGMDELWEQTKGVFVLGAVFEVTWKVEAAEAVPIGGGVVVGAYSVRLDDVRPVEGPNYDADRGALTVTRAGQTICRVRPERRLYVAGGQTTSEVGLCYQGLSHIYVVLGERRAGGTYLVRAYWNPWASLIFVGPVLMGLGGLVSLSDRRLRLGVGRRREQAA